MNQRNNQGGAKALPFSAASTGMADTLRQMLATVETKAGLDAWAIDFMRARAGLAGTDAIKLACEGAMRVVQIESAAP